MGRSENRKKDDDDEEQLPLFETKGAKGRVVFKLFSFSIFVSICCIFAYRFTHWPQQGEQGRWGWILMFLAELWFTLYWIFNQAARWNPKYRYTFKDRLARRYKDDQLPLVDIFVCTADPKIEPPIMVVNTVLSMMAYNYPTEKLSVYLSDDGGSDLTFYALLEASEFSKYWIPFCKKFHIEPRSPAAYFSKKPHLPGGPTKNEEFSAMEKLYEEMKQRIETTTKLGQISKEIQNKHKGFSRWDSYMSRNNHESIVQIAIDGRDPKAVDVDGDALPTLVYMSREKRPNQPHNFKAGAMNSLIRVSSTMSNAPIILNVDCDMYSNNSESIRDALCLLMDEENGNEIAYVQFPQAFEGITKNDIYGASLKVIREVEFPGCDGFGGVLYVGSGCFHRRESLCGLEYNKAYKYDWNKIERRVEKSVDELEEISKNITSCTFEENTQWGKEMGLKYGCPVEDVLTGLTIKCRGWKSMYLNPTQMGFLGSAPITLDQTLVQHKRWAEGNLQIQLSKYNPFIYGHGKIKVGLQMVYCIYNLWAPNGLATLCYLVLPPFYLLKGISLFPMISSLWILAFGYVFITTSVYSLGEFLWSGGKLKGWWNDQRMWVYKRSTSYSFACMDTLFKLLGVAKLKFNITAKVAEDEVLQRYEKEMMEFGTSSPMFTILAFLSLFNLFTLVEGIKRVILKKENEILEVLFVQVLLCGLVVLINLPLYEALFLRRDKGSMPTSLTFKSVVLAILSCIISLY